MHISHGTQFKFTNPKNGYGYATDRMINSLTRLGHKVTSNDPDAPVEIWFDQPQHWKWRQDSLIEGTPNRKTYSHQYRIGYHPWESTKLKDNWVELMNECDEIWTPSPLIAEWYAEDGITVPIYVYQHGVDKIWSPKRRKNDGIFRFLHLGGEAARKEAQMTMEAFRVAFPDRDDVRLTMKMVNSGWKINKIGRCDILNEAMSLEDLVELFHSHHAYVYPSRGEGFGLTPLQAMATGMPTITLPAWAPYRQHLDPRLCVESTLRASPWASTIHPGEMFRPKKDDLVDRMRWVVDNYDDAHDFALNQVPKITEEYDWDKLTDEAFSGLEKRIS